MTDREFIEKMTDLYQGSHAEKMAYQRGLIDAIKRDREMMDAYIERYRQAAN